MTQMFDDIIDAIVNAEGDYVDHPSDRGGPTRFGITEAVARDNGWLGPMKELPLGIAKSIYHARYIIRPGFHRVAAMDKRLARELIDTGVNMGPTRAAMFLQRCLNVFNQRERRYGDVFVDGKIGNASLEALGSFIAHRGEKGVLVLLKALNCVQGERYIQLAEGNPTQEDFVYGWFERVELPCES